MDDRNVTGKATNKGLLLHYQSHVDNKCKHSLLKTMLIRAHRLSSSPDLFADECNNLRSMFLKLKYPPRLIESTINRFVRLQDQAEPEHQFPLDQPIIIVLPFKDQRSADAVRKDLSELRRKLEVICAQCLLVERSLTTSNAWRSNLP